MNDYVDRLRNLPRVTQLQAAELGFEVSLLDSNTYSLLDSNTYTFS